jgi:glyoxylase-like metal-dependent hydrolase (beta-lactamase superfamily II)
MSISCIRFFILFILIFFISQCEQTENLIIKHQVTSAIETNCYLIYGDKTKEAALIDVGGSIDSLIDHITSNKLKVKYILCTHGHRDHVTGIPEILNLFPDAKIVLHKIDYKDLSTSMEWAEKNLGVEFLEWLKSDPERKKLYDFDYRSLGEPDIYIEDNQILNLGHLKIRAIHSPGHSPGSICYHINNYLFSGDVLFYRTVGRTDVQNSSREDQIKSVRRLYDLLPDETKVYSGHGQFTDIGSEKVENTRITVDGGSWITGEDTVHSKSDKL